MSDLLNIQMQRQRINRNTRGPQGMQGVPGKDGKDSTVAGPRGLQGVQGIQGIQGPAVSGQIEYKDGIVVPTMVLVSGTATVDISVTWDTPFADANYTLNKPQILFTNITLLGKVTATIKSKTTTGCIITVTTTGAVSAGNVILGIIAYQKGS